MENGLRNEGARTAKGQRRGVEGSAKRWKIGWGRSANGLRKDHERTEKGLRKG